MFEIMGKEGKLKRNEGNMKIIVREREYMKGMLNVQGMGGGGKGKRELQLGVPLRL